MTPVDPVDPEIPGDGDGTLGGATLYRLTVNVTSILDVDATVTFNGSVSSFGNYMDFAEGTQVTWMVTADGYQTQSGTVVMTEDITVNVSLDEFGDPSPYNNA